MSRYAMDLMKETDFRACGHCGAVYHKRELYRGRGRHLGEHPEHEYAPCGHSRTWFGARPYFVEPEPPTGLEFHEPDYGGDAERAPDGFTVTSDADPGV